MIERVRLEDFNRVPSRVDVTSADLDEHTALPWLERASDLLREPDPGPTPFLVSDLIVDKAIATIVGPWKVAKSYSLLEIAIAIVTGRKAFDVYEVPKVGPVLFVMEESGRSAFHRRLDRLSRGYALAPEALQDLHFAANLGVRLDEESWQEKLLVAGAEIKPQAILLDPLVRLKGAKVDESSQREIGPVLDFMRRLRDESGACVLYSHHTGHQGTHQRGSSDLEGYWESRLALAKDGAGIRTMTAQHREAESGHEFRFVLDFDEATRSLQIRALRDMLESKIEEYLLAHPDASKNEVLQKVGGNRNKGLRLVDEVRSRLSLRGSEPRVPRGTTSFDLHLASGSPDPSSRGSGTTSRAGGTEWRLSPHTGQVQDVEAHEGPIAPAAGADLEEVVRKATR